MKISGISRTGRPLASSGKLRDTRMKRGDEIGRKAISFTSPDDFSEKSVSLGFERTTSNDDFSVQIRSRRQPRSHPPAPPRRHGLLRSLLQILLPRPVQFRVALGAGLDGRRHRAGRDALHLGKPRQTARRAVAQRVALYDRPQQGVRPHRPSAGPAARPPAVERALRRTFRIPRLLSRFRVVASVRRSARPSARTDAPHLRDEPPDGDDAPADRRRTRRLPANGQLPYLAGAAHTRRSPYLPLLLWLLSLSGRNDLV